ncbi:hypothetical protein CN461_29425 [Bacillus thuringiensis]|uniref:Uncharacterized protein n=1 Tax=Bacillus thuringiensis TaxID=1428 RepID=A0ABD6SKJ3_BACTU|nr:hypothetical protein CN511_27185 [Bacillus thuringiensis]PGN12607.1 hypothetical protein CN959_02700 [Bacillus cereus]PEX43345.1 hypothetical protein CN461_29425 [Bacillus thuringiensis]PEZ56820.1 hypothetical protein CN371_31725 [Bacillus thuringiensis]PFE06357.1 hypothetical protein CN303_27175 [Bacillus thuringiensis]
MITGILTPLIRKFVITFVSLLIFYKKFSCVYIYILLLFLNILIFLSFSYRCKRFGVIIMFLNIVDFKDVISGVLIKKSPHNEVKTFIHLISVSMAMSVLCDFMLVQLRP